MFDRLTTKDRILGIVAAALAVIFLVTLATGAVKCQTVEHAMQPGKAFTRGSLVSFTFPGDLTPDGYSASYTTLQTEHEGVVIQYAPDEASFTASGILQIAEYTVESGQTSVVAVLPLNASSGVIRALRTDTGVHTAAAVVTTNSNKPLLKPSGVTRTNRQTDGIFDGRFYSESPTLGDALVASVIAYDLDISRPDYAPQVNIRQGFLSFNVPAVAVALGKHYPGAYLLSFEVPPTIAGESFTVRARACEAVFCVWSETITLSPASEDTNARTLQQRRMAVRR